MITDRCQRWHHGRASYRPAREPFDPRRFEVAPIGLDRTARDFVVSHHYSASYPAARERFALYEGPFLVGVAVFSVPCHARVFDCLPCDANAALELGRFVLLDRVLANAETWFLARCFELLRAEGYEGVVSFSDPMARAGVGGELVFPGHVGTIYQAQNATYLGRGTRRTLYLLPDGTVFSARAAQKVRSGDRGWRYAVAQLEAQGAPRYDSGDRTAWLGRAVDATVRRVRHPGNHKYVWGLTRGVKRRLPDGQPYPKDPAWVRRMALEEAA